MSWLSGFLGGVTGSSAAKAANKATGQQARMDDYQRQLFERYTAPYADMQLGQAQAEQGSLGQLRAILQYLQSGGNAANAHDLPSMPSWLNVPGVDESKFQQTPDWRQPFTSEQNRGLNTLSNLNMNDYLRNVSGNRAQLAGQQGIRMSTEQAGMAPGIMQQMTEARARENANNTMLGMGRGDQLRNEGLNSYVAQLGAQGANRGEQAGNYFNMANLYNQSATKYAPQANTGNWMQALMGMSQNYGNQASNYGQMAGQAMGNLGSAIGTYYGYKAGQK